MVKKPLLVLVVLVFGVTAHVVSLDNRVIDRFLDQSPADVETTIYLAMLGSDPDWADADVVETFQEFNNLGYRTPLRMHDPITTEQFALITMQVLEIPGGVVSRLFRSPRYAYRDMRTYRMIPTSYGPKDELSGEAVIMLLGNVLNWKDRYQ